MAVPKEKLLDHSPTGYPGNLTAEQSAAVAALVKRLEADPPPGGADMVASLTLDGHISAEQILLKFLRATDFDVAHSEERLRATYRWRTTESPLPGGIAGLTLDSCKAEIALGKTKAYFCGRDVHSRPVFVVRVSEHRMGAIPIEQTKAFMLLLLERGRALLRPPVETFSLLMDLAGFGPRNADLAFAKFLILTLRDHYPETLDHCLIVDAPVAFRLFWPLVRPFIDPRTAHKIHFTSRGKALHAFVSPDQLPPALGGTRPPDPFPWEPEFVPAPPPPAGVEAGVECDAGHGVAPPDDLRDLVIEGAAGGDGGVEGGEKGEEEMAGRRRSLTAAGVSPEGCASPPGVAADADPPLPST